MKTFKMIVRRFTLIEVIVLLLIVSYAWFVDRSNPMIEETSIRVTSAEGLYIKLQPDSPARTSINLNQIITHFNTFEIKQVSSANAIDFYYVDFGQGLSEGDPRFVEILPNAQGQIDYNLYGYIDYDFYLQTEDFAKHVYLHKDTILDGLAAPAMRIALTIDDGVNPLVTHIFGDTAENGITDPFLTESAVAEGYFSFGNIDHLLVGPQIVKTFDYFDGGRGLDDSDPLNLSKVLYTMEADSIIKINVKIWLEGGDPECDNTIASSFLDVRVKFGSANVLLPAPTVTPNNGDYTITGLDTTMEYASTNEPATVWTSVSNPSMTFGAAQTVYVRIKEVTGVSPHSYATTVTFN
jgi:hypothetical protein